jgi:hypothetical protein
MSKIISHSIALKRFQSNMENLLYANFTIEQYKKFTAIVKDKVNNDAIKKILKEIIQSKDKELIYNLIYGNIITIMEVYLKDRIIEEFRNKPTVIEIFLKGYTLERKLSVEDVLNGPIALAESIINETIFHNIKKVDAIYKIIFGFGILQFSDYKKLDFIVQIRHKILHQCGIVNDRQIRITPLGFIFACETVNRFVEGIDYYYRYRRIRKRYPKLILKHSTEYDELFKWDEYKDKIWCDKDFDIDLKKKEKEEIII